jgi:hypothetical protein
MKHFPLSLLAIMIFFCPTNAQKKLNDKIVIKNVNVISADPAQPEMLKDYDVVIANGTIKKIKPTGGGYKGYELIDGTGKYLIPGMADMHAHLPWQKSSMQNREYNLFNLLNGVTTIRQMRGKTEDLPVRDSIRRGLMTGCNMYISAPPFFWDKNFSEQLCRDSFTSFRKQGYDFVKYVGGLNMQQFDTFMAVAASLNMKATGHAHRNDLVKAVASNQYTIEHISAFVSLYQRDSSLFWKTIDVMVKKDLYYCPDFRFYIIEGTHTPMEIKKKSEGLSFLDTTHIASIEKEYVEYVNQLYTRNPVALAKSIIGDSTTVAISRMLLPRMYAKGVKVLVSPAAGDFFVPGFSFIDEMEILVASGLTPYQSIKCATYTSAECLESLDKWGTISENKQADMVLLSANPLEDIKNLRKVETTFINGRPLTRQYLLSELQK